jgi:hypothetical protein
VPKVAVFSFSSRRSACAAHHASAPPAGNPLQ